jgi:uncharacterized protein YycO
MWYRTLFALLILSLMTVVTPVRAANNTPQPNDPQPSKSIDEQPVTIQPVTLSPAASKALASNDYTTVALALFSAQSPADIDALTPAFERLRPKSTLASPQSTATLLQLIKFITGDQYMAGKLTKTHYDNLKKGDILLRRTGLLGCKQWIIVPLCKYWALVYEHAGLYYGYYNGRLSVYESSNEGGVQFKFVDTWKSSNYYVGIHRSRVDGATIAKKFDVFIAKYGTNGQTPYNYNLLDKYTDKALYCSQLVWKFYNSVGVNVDSDHPLYAEWLKVNYGPLLADYVSKNAVAPDEIGMSTNIYRMAAGWNP